MTSYEEFQDRFSRMTDEELAEAYNADIVKSGWVGSRADFHGALCAEFEKRGYALSSDRTWVKKDK